MHGTDSRGHVGLTLTFTSRQSNTRPDRLESRTGIAASIVFAWLSRECYQLCQLPGRSRPARQHVAAARTPDRPSQLVREWLTAGHLQLDRGRDRRAAHARRPRSRPAEMTARAGEQLMSNYIFLIMKTLIRTGCSQQRCQSVTDPIRGLILVIGWSDSIIGHISVSVKCTSWYLWCIHDIWTVSCMEYSSWYSKHCQIGWDWPEKGYFGFRIWIRILSIENLPEWIPKSFPVSL